MYEWGSGRVLKLLLPGLPASWITSEAEKTRLAHQAGAPAPAVYEPVEIDGRHGVVFDRAGTQSMLDEIIARPWRSTRWGVEFAQVHAAVLNREASALPDVKDFLAGRIDEADGLPRSHRSRAKDSLRPLPDGRSLLHGDFHPDNVFLPLSTATVIDWTEAARGNVAADVARTMWLMSASAIPPDLPRRNLAIALVGVLRWSYLRGMKSRLGVTVQQISSWRLPVLVSRFSEGIEYESEALQDEIASLLAG